MKKADNRLPVFINPFIDRGFKILFGQPESKEVLIGLLNDFLEGERLVTDLTYLNTVEPAETNDARSAIFDLKCKDQEGNIFIVELQNLRQPYFYERGLYYICRNIASQGRIGNDWKFNLTPVYGIFLLNFRTFRTDKVRRDIVLADRETGEIACNIIREIFIEFPLFNKKEEECKCPLDYWLYNLKYMEQLETLSFKGQRALFRRLEQLAKLANMNNREREEYEECLKVYRDNKNTWEYGMEEAEMRGEKRGEKRGEERGIKKIARNMKLAGVSLSLICQCTGLSEDEINAL